MLAHRKRGRGGDASRRDNDGEPSVAVIDDGDVGCDDDDGDDLGEGAPFASASATEADVDIVAFVSASRGFRGIIKHKLSDFIVREIARDGTVARLTTTAPPPPASGDEAISPGAGGDAGPAVAVMRQLAQLCGGSRDDGAASGAGAALDAVWKHRRAVDASAPRDWRPSAAPGGGTTVDATSLTVDAAAECAAALPSRVTLSAPADKDGRKAVHQLLRQLLPGCESVTEGASVIATPAHGRGGAGGGGSGAGGWQPSASRRGWAVGRPDFVRFVLHKRDRDTADALAALACAAGVRPDALAVAGSKDRRGVTSQFVTAWRVQPETLARANAALGGSVLLGDWSFVKKRLRLGDLRGNRFSLVVRRIGAPPGDAAGAAPLLSADGGAYGDAAGGGAAAARAAVAAAMAAWASAGHAFVNYFGLQRFGTGRVPTHAVGRALLQGRPVDAVVAILAARAGSGDGDVGGGDGADGDAALRGFARGDDPAAALRRLPRRGFPAEAAVLGALADAGVREGAAEEGDPAPRPLAARIPASAAAAALAALPFRTRQLYIHAYQSSLWNRAATARLQALGAAPAVGDLVLVAAGGAEDDDEEGGGGGGAAPAGAVQGRLPPVRRLTAADFAAPPAATAADPAAGPRRPYALSDVLIPVPGFAVEYPGTAVASASAFAAMLRGDGFELPSPEAVSANGGGGGGDDDAVAAAQLAALWKPRGAAREAQLTGGYRRLVAVATDVRWRIVTHADADGALAVTDAEALHAATATRPPRRADEGEGEGAPAADGATAAADAAAAPHASLLVDFSLPKSAYATMALREFMRPASTQKAYQAHLSQADAGARGGAAVGAAALGCAQ